MAARHPTEERRLQIADAALQVIATQGLGRFTTQAIAAEVGITDGTLFRHFPNKEAIVLAALDRVEERLFSGFPPDVADPIERLERLFLYRASLVTEHPVIARLAFSEELPHAAGPVGARQVARWRERTLGFVVGCIDEAAAQGRIDPEIPAREVGCVVMGTLLALARFRDGAEPGAPARAWSLVERMLRPIPPQERT